MNNNNSIYASTISYHSGGVIGTTGGSYNIGYTLGNGSTSSIYPVSGNVNVSSSTSWGASSWGNSYTPPKTSVDIFKDIFKAAVDEHDKKKKDGIFTRTLKETLRRKDEGIKSKKELIKELKQCNRESQRDTA